MDRRESESHSGRRPSPPAPKCFTHVQETEVDLSAIITNAPNVTTAPPPEPITTMTHTDGGDTHVTGMGIVGSSSPSSCSDGSSSSSGFVKVEHSDVQPSDGDVATATIGMEQLLRMDHDDDDKDDDDDDEMMVSRSRSKGIEMDNHGFGSVSHHEFVSDEPQSGVLPRAQEFVESAIEKVTNAASAGAEKVAHEADTAYKTATDVANAAALSASEVSEKAGGVLGDTVHLAGDTLEDTTQHVGDRTQHSYEDFANMSREAAQRFGDQTYQAYEGFADASRDAASNVGEKAHQAYEHVADASRGAIEAAKEFSMKVGEKAQQAYDSTKDTASAVFEKASDKAYQGYEGFADAFRGASDSAKDTASDMSSGTVHEISDTAQAARDKVAEVAQIVTESAKSTGDAVTGAAAGAIHMAEDSAADLGHKIVDSGANVFTGTDLHGTAMEHDLIGLTDHGDAKGEHGDIKLDQPAVADVGAVVPPSYQPAEQRLGSDWEQYGGTQDGEDKIHDEITGVHDQIASMIEQMHATATTPPQHGGGVAAAEESTFDRKGPLTIPLQVPGGDTLQLGETESSRHGHFEVSPRPPTPPKELDDEDVKPTTIDVGQQSHRSPSSGEYPRSILKRASQGRLSLLNPKWMDSKILDLLHWRDPKKSGAVLGITVLTLLIFAKFPLVAVLSYLGLAVLGGTFGFRIYKLIEAQIKKTDGANPFQPYLNREFRLPQEKVHQQVDVLIEHAQLIGNELRRLFLVENITDSIKFGLLLWALTYVSSWFSGLCLLILFVLAIFTIPKVYEVYHEPIDHNMSLVKQHVDNVSKKVCDKVPPFLKKSTAPAAAGDVNHEKSN